MCSVLIHYLHEVKTQLRLPQEMKSAAVFFKTTKEGLK